MRAPAAYAISAGAALLVLVLACGESEDAGSAAGSAAGRLGTGGSATNEGGTAGRPQATGGASQQASGGLDAGGGAAGSEAGRAPAQAGRAPVEGGSIGVEAGGSAGDNQSAQGGANVEAGGSAGNGQVVRGGSGGVSATGGASGGGAGEGIGSGGAELGTSFGCGGFGTSGAPTSCVVGQSYCVSMFGGTGGGAHFCIPLVDECAGQTSCECICPGASCEQPGSNGEPGEACFADPPACCICDDEGGEVHVSCGVGAP